MKKSQLRKIIRESIKGLINEQTNQNYRYCKVSGCNTGFGGTYKMRIDGQPPVAGDVFQTPYSGIGTGALQGVMIVREVYSNWGGSPLPKRNFTAYTGPDCCPQACWDPSQVPPPTSGNITGWGTPAYFTVYGVDPNPYSPGPNGMNGGCSSNTGPNCVSYGSTPCTTYGCTDPTATNYNSTILPNCGDNSCVWLGCTDSTASNYDPTATVDDGSCITTTSCDTTPASACATQWFQNPNANWAANWMNNRDCSNYTWPSTNLEQQAISIMAGAPTPQTGPYNNWNDIWSAGQNSGLSPANAFIAKMAKAKYSQCQKQACNC